MTSNRHYDRRRRAAINAGTFLHSEPIDRTRNHIAYLHANGMSYYAIADAAQCSNRTIRTIAAGERPTVRGTTAAAILALTPVMKPRPSLTNATGTARRLRALMVIGWPIMRLADELGTTTFVVGNWVHEKLPLITVACADRVRVAYDRLSMTDGGSVRAKKLAERNGWVSPLAWDDDTIDDPDARPDLGGEDSGEVDEIAVEAAVAGSPILLTRQVDQLAAIEALTGLGVSVQEIALRLGMKPGTVSQLKHRHLRSAA